MRIDNCNKVEKTISFQSILNLAAGFYILTYMLPSGIIAGVPIQKYAVCLFAGLSALVFLQKRVVAEIIKNSVFETALLGTALVWCLYSALHGQALSVKFAELLYISVMIFLVFVFLVKYDLIDIRFIIRCVFLMLLLKSAGRFVMEAAFLLKMISYEEIVPFYELHFGTFVSTMTMDLGSLELVRIQCSSDAIVVSLMPFFWVMPKFGKRIKAGLFIITGIYVMIVFSRIFIAQFCCSAIVILLYYWKKIPRKAIYIGAAVFVVSAFFWLEPVVSMIKFRFFSSFSVESDSVRNIQGEKLLEGIRQKPWLGHGMGSYLPDYIRSEAVPFSYEKEYLSFVYQLGIVGFVALIGGNICIYVRKLYAYVRKNIKIVQVFSLLCMAWFLVRPLFNPSFLGLQNGFSIIGTLLLNVYYVKEADGAC